jgi:hypothetical protein
MVYIVTKRLYRYKFVADGETAAGYGGRMLIYGKSSCGQPTKGGPPAWGLGKVLKTCSM